ncbi:MAG TPA: hypothetical protein EYP32_00515 [Aquificaceae bacterium]|nr:hypothetical protein [Aquificaceae bacterium]
MRHRPQRFPFQYSARTQHSAHPALLQPQPRSRFRFRHRAKLTKRAKRLRRHKRVCKKVFGTSERPRLCVYKSLISLRPSSSRIFFVSSWEWGM